jgi:hypothetical protein
MRQVPVIARLLLAIGKEFPTESFEALIDPRKPIPNLPNDCAKITKHTIPFATILSGSRWRP